MDYLIVAHLFGLLCHQELHDGASGLRHVGARTEDGGYACFIEEVIVLRGDISP